MRKIGMRVLVTAMIAASIMLASCKYDTEPEDSKKNEETGTKLSIVWDNWASKSDVLSKTDGIKRVFISTMLYGTKNLPEKSEELPEISIEGMWSSISLDKYETEYKAKLGIGDKYFSEETAYALDTAKRYMNDKDEKSVYVCYFKYYANKDYTNEITSIDIADKDVTVYAYAMFEEAFFSNLK